MARAKQPRSHAQMPLRRARRFRSRAGCTSSRYTGGAAWRNGDSPVAAGSTKRDRCVFAARILATFTPPCPSVNSTELDLAGGGEVR